MYVAIAGEVVNRRSVLLRNFVANGKESASNPLLHIHAKRYTQYSPLTSPGLRRRAKKKHFYEVKAMEWEYVWDSIYSKEGEVQKDALPTVVSAAELFKSASVKNVLDLGCGTGRHSIFLANSGFVVTATDISEHGVTITQKRAQEKGLNIKVLCHDMRKIPSMIYI